MRERRRFGDRYHFSGDNCDPGKCPSDRELPTPDRWPSIPDELARVGDNAIKRREKLYRGSNE